MAAVRHLGNYITAVCQCPPQGEGRPMRYSSNQGAISSFLLWGGSLSLLGVLYLFLCQNK